jgi:hypothetical protein
MKIPINAFTALIVLLPLSAFAMAVADGLTVKRQVKEGQIYTLNLKASLEVAGQQASFTALTPLSPNRLGPRPMSEVKISTFRTLPPWSRFTTRTVV